MPLVEVPGLGTVEFPEGTPPEQMEAAIKGAMGGSMGAPSTAEKVAGGIGQVGAGFNQGLSRAVGGVLDLPGGAARMAGGALGVPEQYLPKPDFFAKAIQGGINSVVGTPAPPQSTMDHVLHGAGQGVADAASVFIPATALAQSGRLGQAGQAVAGALSANAPMQATAGAVGGGVSEGTGNPLLGTGAAIATPLAAGGVSSIFGRIAAPVRPSANPAHRDALALAEREGVAEHLTPGQQSGSQHLRRAETLMRYVPGNGPDAQNAGLMDAYQRAMLRRVGSDAAAPTDAVLDNLQRTQGGRIGDIMARNQLDLNPGTPGGLQNVQELAAPLRQAQRVGVGNNANEVLRQYEDLLGKVQNGGVVEGGAVRELRTRLKEMADGMEGSNADLARYLREMRGALTRGMERSMVATDAADWQEANRLYANIKVLRDAKSGTGQVAAGDQINPAQLSAALRRSVGPDGMSAGRGDLHDLADMGKLLVEPSVKDSGTAGNTLVGKAMFGGAAAGLSTIDPLSASLAFGPTLAYRAGAATGYLNPRLPPQLAPEVTPQLLAAVLAARGRTAAAGPAQQPQPAPNAALPAALLSR